VLEMGLSPAAPGCLETSWSGGLDPTSENRDASLARADRLAILICDEGYQSSLAAANLAAMAVRAGDVIGGFQSWIRAGLLAVPLRAGV